jgi:trehalose 6-phosphate phosphatase
MGSALFNHSGSDPPVTSEPIHIPPDELASLIAGRHPLQVIGFDVDGVLAPIVDRADQARLLPGMTELLLVLSGLTPTAVVSGRSLSDLEDLYGFPAEVEVIGSHGLESRRHPNLILTDAETAVLQQLRACAQRSAEQAGPGAWCEHKPASVVLHTRLAAPTKTELAVAQLLDDAAGIASSHIKLGHQVVELLARQASKAVAMTDLRARHGALCMTFFGDDHTDEEVFATFGPNDISVRIGPGKTAARYFLQDPSEVLMTLTHLTELLRQDRAQPDRAQPDRAQPDRAQPDRAQPDRAQPDRA